MRYICPVIFRVGAWPKAPFKSEVNGVQYRENPAVLVLFPQKEMRGEGSLLAASEVEIIVRPVLVLAH